MADLIEEVEDDLRAERLRARLRRWAPLAGLAVLAVVVAIGAWQWRALATERRARDASQAFFAAMRADDAATAAQSTGGPAPSAAAYAAIAAQPRDPVGVRVLASFGAAGIEGRAGHAAAANALLDGVAGEAAAPHEWRAAATLLAAQRDVGTVGRDALAARLRPLEVSGEPFRALAMETEAMADLSAGDLAATRAMLAQIVASDQVGRGQRERDSTLLQALAPEPGDAGAHAGPAR